MTTKAVDETIPCVDSLFNVNGIVALVTGGGSGLGLMFSRVLARNGASKVYIVGRRKDVLDAAANSIGPNVIPIQCDVTSKSSLKEAAAFVERDAGFLNLLVCNSGIGGPAVKALTPDMSAEDWADENFEVDYDAYVNTFAVNSVSPWYTSLAFLSLLDKGNKKKNIEQTSQVVIVSSIAGFNKRAPGGWAYGQSKAATTLVAKQLSTVLPRWNIRTNCIAPGLVPSDMSAPIVEKYGGDSSNFAVPVEMVPMGRMGDEQDMGGAILYLASRGGSYCNGAVIVVDGGRLTTFPSTS